jgi:hypothetical protein
VKLRSRPPDRAAADRIESRSRHSVSCVAEAQWGPPKGPVVASLEAPLTGATERSGAVSFDISIILVVGSLRTGGTERQVCLLANGLQQQENVQVSIALLGGVAESAFPLVSDVELLSLGPGGWFGMLMALKRLRRLGR